MRAGVGYGWTHVPGILEPPLMLHFDAAAPPFGLGVLVCEVHTLVSFGCSWREVLQAVAL